VALAVLLLPATWRAETAETGTTPPVPAEAEPGFRAPEPLTLRRFLLPAGSDIDGGTALILTDSATGGDPVIITDTAALTREAPAAHVDYAYMSDGQYAAAIGFTFGLALQNQRTFALLVRNGEVADRLTCWRCDVRLPDFVGASTEGLLAAARPVREARQSLRTEAEFDAALAEATGRGDIIIDRTAQFGRQNTGEAAFWMLVTWIVDPE
jgi:hypothetical protein